MTILHTTDLHFNKPWFEWISKQQDKYDVFCITGDFLEDSKEETLLEQIEWISNWMKSFTKPLFICSGNHDIEELENEDWYLKVNSIYSDNSIKTINGVKFGSIPYIAAEFYEYDECDVLLYHLPPSNTKTSIHNKTNEDWGDKEFYRNIKKGILSPKIVLCGHMHYPIDVRDKINNTTIYNPGVDILKKVPNHNILKI